MRRPAARRAVSPVGAVACSHCCGWFGSAGWSFSARARLRRVVAGRVTLVLVSCCWPWACCRARQRTRSTVASWRPLPGVARSRRALTVSLVQLPCRRYQPRGVSRALPWRVPRRRSGSRMVVGLRRECSGSGGAWRGGLPRSGTSTSMCGWPWAGLVRLGSAGWPRG